MSIPSQVTRFFTFMKDRNGFITKERLHEWLQANLVLTLEFHTGPRLLLHKPLLSACLSVSALDAAQPYTMHRQFNRSIPWHALDYEFPPNATINLEFVLGAVGPNLSQGPASAHALSRCFISSSVTDLLRISSVFSPRSSSLSTSSTR